MKKKITLLFSVVAVCLIMLLSACANYTSSLVFYEIQEGDSFYGEFAGEVAVVDDTNGTIKKLIVPQTYNGKPVVLIGPDVFGGYENLTEVQLPEGLKSIESAAFAYCESLTYINLPESLLFIGSGAFEGNSELLSVSFSNKVFRIADDAFKGCIKLQDIYYNGTQEDWGRIDIWKGNEYLLNAEIHFSE